MRRYLWKLIRLQLSRVQLAGFVLANFLGMCILLCGIMFYTDVIPVFTGGDSFLKEEYIVLSKPVNALRTLKGETPTFTEAEIRQLRSQPFAKNVAPFQTARFGVTVYIGTPDGNRLSTEMFFEALPDEFIDADLSEWDALMADTAASGDASALPIIMPRNYLNLYNFGYAGSQGLPPISEGIASSVGLHFLLRGTHEQMQIDGRIAGFSNRLNTILVPLSFLNRANERLSPGRDASPSRLCLSVNNPADPSIATYLNKKHYQTEGTGADAGRTAHFLRMICIAVMAVGGVICVLAFYVLLLSIYLLLQKHAEKIRTLLLLGFPARQVALPFQTIGMGLTLLTFALALPASLYLRSLYVERIEEVYHSFEPTVSWFVFVVAAVLVAVLCMANAAAVRRKISI